MVFRPVSGVSSKAVKQGSRLMVFSQRPTPGCRRTSDRQLLSLLLKTSSVGAFATSGELGRSTDAGVEPFCEDVSSACPLESETPRRPPYPLGHGGQRELGV